LRRTRRLLGTRVAKNVSSGSTVATKAVDKVKSSFSNLAKTALTLGGGLALAKVFNDSIAEARESYRVNRLTAQALKSTGDASNVSAGQVSHLADSLSGVVGIDDEVIQGMENLLLRFTKVRNEAGKGNDIFNRTTKAILDVSAATGKGLTPVTIALGKALTDPIKGMAGLARFGVQFTDQQKAQIKTLVDSGHQLEAQKVILDSLGQRFGGAAKAAADPMQRLGVTFKNLEENLGKLLVPALNVGVAALQSFVSFVQNNAKTIKVLTAVLAPLVAGLTAMLIVKKVGDGIKAMREAVIALNIAMDANPAILIAGAIAALGVGLVIAYQKIKPFHDAVDAVGRALRDAFGWVQDHWRQILPILIAPFIATADHVPPPDRRVPLRAVQRGRERDRRSRARRGGRGCRRCSSGSGRCPAVSSSRSVLSARDYCRRVSKRSPGSSSVSCDGGSRSKCGGRVSAYASSARWVRRAHGSSRRVRRRSSV
jgi:hypothetical protein